MERAAYFTDEVPKVTFTDTGFVKGIISTGEQKLEVVIPIGDFETFIEQSREGLVKWHTSKLRGVRRPGLALGASSAALADIF